MQIDHSQLELGRPEIAERSAALQLAWAYLAPAERNAQIVRLLYDAHVQPELLDGLLRARRAKQVVGAIWAQLQPGSTAFLSLPQLTAGEPAETERALLDSLLEVLDQRQIRLAQALLKADYGAEFDLLRAGRFEHFADLLYLASLARVFPDEQPTVDLDFEPYADRHHDRLSQILQRTYVDSQDCPRLTGIRQMTDIIAGYRATGVFDPDRWLFIRHQGTDVGCLLLAEHAQAKPRLWEVAYVGLVPAARRRGWGLATVRQAQWLARRAGVERLLLAVDAANAPAIAAYAAAGFNAWDRRTVMLRIFG